MSTQSNKVKLSITVDIEIHEAVKQLASEDDRNVSSMINKILKDFIKEQEKG